MSILDYLLRWMRRRSPQHKMEAELSRAKEELEQSLSGLAEAKQRLEGSLARNTNAQREAIRLMEKDRERIQGSG